MGRNRVPSQSYTLRYLFDSSPPQMNHPVVLWTVHGLEGGSRPGHSVGALLIVLITSVFKTYRPYIYIQLYPLALQLSETPFPRCKACSHVMPAWSQLGTSVLKFLGHSKKLLVTCSQRKSVPLHDVRSMHVVHGKCPDSKPNTCRLFNQHHHGLWPGRLHGG